MVPVTRRELTERQAKILSYLQNHVCENGFFPTIREIGQEFGIGSLRGVSVHLDALERKGYLSRRADRRGRLHIVRGPSGRPVELVYQEVEG